MEIEAAHGPALRAVQLTDDRAVRALFVEQRGLLAVVRSNRIWQWLGGVPSGFGHPSAALHGVYCVYANFGIMAVALVVAGFIRGPILIGLVVLAELCLIARPILTGAATRKTLALFARGVQLPAIVLRAAVDPEREGLAKVVVLVGMNVKSSDDLSAVVAVGDHLRGCVNGRYATPQDLEPLVQSIRDRSDFDGSRTPVPPSIGSGYEIAFLCVNPLLLPGEGVDSQLLFVFADPECREAAHTRVVRSDLWGHGVEGLCDALPLEDAA